MADAKKLLPELCKALHNCGYVKQMIMQSILFNLLIINYTYLSYLALCF